MRRLLAAAVVVGAGAAVVARAQAKPPTVVTLAELRQLTPRLTEAQRAHYLPYLNAALHRWGITTLPRVAAALGQWLHESWQFSALVEIAPNVAAYAGNRGLGNRGSVDAAARYIGRGATMLTGAFNYERAAEALGLDLVTRPELAAAPEHTFNIAGWFWVRGTSVDLNTLADRGDFDGITRRINGGMNGAEDRRRYHAQALTVLGPRLGKGTA
jgi:putative chitinase